MSKLFGAVAANIPRQSHCASGSGRRRCGLRIPAERPLVVTGHRPLPMACNVAAGHGSSSRESLWRSYRRTRLFQKGSTPCPRSRFDSQPTGPDRCRTAGGRRPAFSARTAPSALPLEVVFAAGGAAGGLRNRLGGVPVRRLGFGDRRVGGDLSDRRSSPRSSPRFGPAGGAGCWCRYCSACCTSPPVS